jgi:competence protein ComEC
MRLEILYFVIGIFFSVNLLHLFAQNFPIAFLIGVVILSSGIYVSVKKKKFLILPFLISGFLSGALSSVAIHQPVLSPEIFQNQHILPSARGIYTEITCKIDTFPEPMPADDESSVLRYRVRSQNLSLVGEALSLLYPGQIVKARGRLYSRQYGDKIFYSLYITDFSTAEYDLSDIEGLPPPSDISSLKILHNGFVPMILISKTRLWINNKIETVRSDDVRALMYSIILGNRNFLDYSVRESFRRTGVSHILALSGLHVGIISLGIVFILGLFMKKNYAYGIATIIIVMYIAVAGFRPSLIRAGLMFAGFNILKASGRDTEFIDVLAFSALVILSANPSLINDIGFLLSYGATLGIYLLYHKFKRYLDFTGAISGILSVSLCATISTAPLILYFFNEISTVSFISNLLIVPVFGIIAGVLFTNFAVIALDLEFLSPLFEFFILLGWRFADWVSDTLSLLPFSVIASDNFSVTGLITGYILMFIAFFALPKFRTIIKNFKSRNMLNQNAKN